MRMAQCAIRRRSPEIITTPAFPCDEGPPRSRLTSDAQPEDSSRLTTHRTRVRSIALASSKRYMNQNHWNHNFWNAGTESARPCSANVKSEGGCRQDLAANARRMSEGIVLMKINHFRDMYARNCRNWWSLESQLSDALLRIAGAARSSGTEGPAAPSPSGN
jgi:hypothetical protein